MRTQEISESQREGEREKTKHSLEKETILTHSKLKSVKKVLLMLSFQVRELSCLSCVFCYHTQEGDGEDI